MTTFLNAFTWHYVRTYFTARTSVFRQLQSQFLEQFGAQAQGLVVEIGCERHYDHKRFLPHAADYFCTNIDRDYDVYCDVTQMKEFADASIDTLVCISVLEHVPDIWAAAREIRRTLKPGGILLLTMPFAYRYHDIVDYWRFSPDSYSYLFEGFDIQPLVHLGGKFAVMTEELQMIGRNKPRHLIYKLIGFALVLCGIALETEDRFPLGYGVVAVKQAGNGSVRA